MKPRLPSSFAAVLLALAPALVLAQDEERAPYRPTPQAIVERMLELAKVRADDYVVDLGSGDGRIVLTAAKKYGARGLGVEIDRSLVRAAQRAAEREGIAERAQFAVQDLFETRLESATVLTLYLLPEMNRKLAPKILAEMQPGTRVVAQEFVVGDWPPDYKETAAGNEEWTGWRRERGVYLWIVPARIGGEWRVERDGGDGRAERASGEFTLGIAQHYQSAEGRARHDATEIDVAFAPIRGREVRFALPPSPIAGDYVGSLDGDVLQGTWSGPGGTGGTWRAMRKKAAKH
jgi:hypothetical protein